MNPPTQPTVEEVVRELQHLGHLLGTGHMPASAGVVADAIALLSALEKYAGRWVPWNHGDAVSRGLYWCCVSCGPKYSESRVVCRLSDGTWNLGHPWQVIAYWSQTLPPPYIPIDLARGQS